MQKALHTTLLLCFGFLSATCTKQDEVMKISLLQQINGRNLIPIYRAKIPNTWMRRDPSAQESIADTTQPLCEWIIREGEEEIRITLHNFPTEKINERIPPTAQIARWKRQFDYLEATAVSITPQAFAGFCGMRFEGRGEIKGIDTAVMGWSMQLASEHYHALDDATSNSRQRRADYTIKVVGSPKLLEKQREAIIAFARSFELIEEIHL